MASPPITAPRRGAGKAPKASRPRLWRSSAGGLQPPDPLGLRPPAPAERRRGHPRTSSAVSRAGPFPYSRENWKSAGRRNGKRSASGPKGGPLWARQRRSVGMWATRRVVQHVHAEGCLVHQAAQAGHLCPPFGGPVRPPQGGTCVAERQHREGGAPPKKGGLGDP